MTDFMPGKTPFTGRRMLAIIVSFFAVIIAVNGTMLGFAVNTFGGLVVGNSYVASQHFNEDVAAARAQPIRGWSLDVTARSETVNLSVRDRDGAVIEGLDLSLHIIRPTHERDAVILPLAEGAAGSYSGRTALGPGRWTGTLSTADGQTRSLTFTHRVPAS